MDNVMVAFLVGMALGALVIDMLASRNDRDRQYLIDLLKEDLRKREGKK